MALAALTTAVWDAYTALRSGHDDSMAGKAGYSALVRDLVVGDVIVGTRGTVTVVGASSTTDTTVRTITVEVRGGMTGTYSWPNGGPIWLAR